MEPIKSFTELTSHLKNIGRRRRIAVVCANDPETEYAVNKALADGFADFVMVGDADLLKQYPTLFQFPEERVTIVDIKNSDEAARHAVQMARNGEVDAIMKGIINTDNLLHAILNKETGILPRGRVLTHLTAAQIPAYSKLLFFSDAAVIPYPTLEQREAMLRYEIDTCHRFGIEEPRIALIHFTEKVNPKFPNSVDYAELVKRQAEGEPYGHALISGPMDAKTACDAHSAAVKGIKGAVAGDADALLFPNIESANTFYKALTCFAGAEMAGMLMGPDVPVILPSRSDSGATKYNSLAMATLCAGELA